MLSFFVAQNISVVSQKHIQEMSTFSVKLLDTSLAPVVWISMLCTQRPQGFSLCYCQFSLRSCIFGFPASLLHPNMLISNCPSPFTTCFYQLFSQSTTKQREGSLDARGELTQPGTLSINFSSSPSPSVIDKQSFPYAVEGVMALTEGGMLWGENIVQQWHRSNLGLAEWFHQGFLLSQSVWPRGPCQPCC